MARCVGKTLCDVSLSLSKTSKKKKKRLIGSDSLERFNTNYNENFIKL